MCLIVFGWEAHPRYSLVVAGNRDEFFARPSAALSYWDDYPGVVGGRDVEIFGTGMQEGFSLPVGVVWVQAVAKEFADDLRRFSKDEPIRARPVSTIGRALRWSRRHPMPVKMLWHCRRGWIRPLLTTPSK